MQDNSNTKECPQCDGKGNESMGLRPSQCRRCKGAGVVEKTIKEASIPSCSSSNQLVAVAGFQKVGAAQDDEDLSSFGYYGSGIDEELLGIDQLTPTQIIDEIYTLMEMMSDEQVEGVFGIACEMAGTTADERKSLVIDSTSDFNPSKAKTLIWNYLGKLDPEKLKQAFLRIRQI